MTKKQFKNFSIKADVNKGAAIMAFAGQYSKSILDVVDEMIQNQIDSGAKKGEIKLDLRKNRLTTRDNGEGTSPEKMKRRLENIGTRFSHGDKIGQMNLGNLAPIGVSEVYSLTSRPRLEYPSHPFFIVSFDRSKIQGNENPEFECKYHLDNKMDGFSKEGWTTTVSAPKIEDSALRSLAREKDPVGVICSRIGSSFRVKIRETGIKIKVIVVSKAGISKERIVEPLDYPGREERIEIQTPSGVVNFKMSLTSSPQKKPEILVDHYGKWQFPLSNLDIWSEVSHVFLSGHIQGLVQVNFCRLTSNRKRFAHSKDLEYFNQAISEFVQNHAQVWVEELQGERSLDKFEEVARSILESIKTSDLFKEFPEVFDEFAGSRRKSPSSNGKLEGKGTNKPGKKNPKKDKSPKKPPSKTPSDKKKRKVGLGKNFDIINGDWVGTRAKMGTEGEEEGRFVINVMHEDYRNATNKGGLASLTKYIEQLIHGFLSSKMCKSDEAGERFWEQYESTYMDVFSLVGRKSKK